MMTNVGTVDRAVRIVIGAALLISIFLVEGGWRWVGLVGFVPLFTAFVGWCPAYTLFGISTCPRGRSGKAAV
ncbi:MAG: DUF2892 domain-containing protein [Rhodospirillaceae bacterium]|nr:DUF2892 domain-containing protein [Rhodospirillaceae bacterium]